MRQKQQLRHWLIMRKLEGMYNGKSVPELAEELGTSERTVYRDLATLQDAGFPITSERTENETRYRIMDGANGRLTFTVGKSELVALYLSQGLLKLMEGTVFEESLTSLMEKIKAVVPPEHLVYFHGIEESLAVGKAATRDYASKRPVISEILNALSKQQTLEMLYFSPGRGKETTRRVDPYKLWLVGDAFYLIGFCHVNKEVRTFLLDRIKTAKTTQDKFNISEGFDFSEYIKDTFRVLRDEKPLEVLVRFAPEVAHTLREKKWHPSQELIENPDGSVTVRIEARGLNEIRSWILSWGEMAEVIEPEELRQELQKTFMNLIKVYQK
jgi:predicted DNA-binding transcriptional regulator YafY